MTLSVSLAAEGDLDEQVLRQLLKQSGREIFAGVCYGKHGRDHLKQNIPRFNHAARFRPFIVLADLEDASCVVRPRTFAQSDTRSFHIKELYAPRRTLIHLSQSAISGAEQARFLTLEDTTQKEPDAFIPIILAEAFGSRV